MILLCAEPQKQASVYDHLIQQSWIQHSVRAEQDLGLPQRKEKGDGPALEELPACPQRRSVTHGRSRTVKRINPRN